MFSFARSSLLRSGIRRLGSNPSFSTSASADSGGGRIGMAAIAVATAGSGLLGFMMLPSFADSGDHAMRGDQDLRISVQDDEAPTVSKSRFLFGDSIRRRVFFNYEKRIRLRSPPEKIFEYFASVRNSDGEVFMKPADLMRAVVPVFPPSESDIVKGGRLRGEPNPGELRCAPSDFFLLFDTNNDGLISFPEYIFFLTLLSIPESSFSVAFKMFDLDHNGEIEIEEFKKVMELMRDYSRQGKRSGSRMNRSAENSGLIQFFFGEDGNGKLKYETFVEFLRDLHEEIVRLEFAHYDFKSCGTISTKDFALSMVASADLNHINKLLDRVDDMANKPHLKELCITYEEFKAFTELRRKLEPLSLAIFTYGKVNGLLTKKDFVRAAYYVCGVSLTENVIDIIFHVFDSDGDGNLSTDEFLRALQRRENDLCRPSKSGMAGVIDCLMNCSSGSSLPHMRF
ncbi:calcium-binding EF hand family protein [Carex rostrata]